jgi:hypothetical protein
MGYLPNSARRDYIATEVFNDLVNKAKPLFHFFKVSVYFYSVVGRNT